MLRMLVIVLRGNPIVTARVACPARVRQCWQIHEALPPIR
jgi:hypothetical protein